MSKVAKHGPITVAVDFSKMSDYAIIRAINIAEETSAELTILHVIQKKSVDVFLDSILEKMLPKELWLSTEEFAKSQLQDKIRNLSHVGIKINYAILSEGHPGTKILQYAKKNKTALLILGAHGDYSLSECFIGTTAEFITKKAPCPVLLVKNEPKRDYKNILVPTDFSKGSKKALDYAMKFIPGCKINLVHVGDYDYEKLLQRQKGKIAVQKLNALRKGIILYLESAMKKFIKGYRLNKSSYKIILGYPGPNILKTAEKYNSDLIIMGSEGRSKIHHLYIGSVANWVLIDTKKDLLLVPPK